MRKKIGAYKYVECSAKTGEGVYQVLEAAARCALMPNTNTATKKKGIFRHLFGTGSKNKRPSS